MPKNASPQERQLINEIRQKSIEAVVSTPEAAGIEFPAYRQVFREYTTAAGHQVRFDRNGDITLSRRGAGSAGNFSDNRWRHSGEGRIEREDNSGSDNARGAPRCVGDVFEF